MRRGLVLVGLAASARALTTRSSRVVTRGNWRSGMRGGSVVQMSSAPREVEVQAAADFKMITEEEATVRKGAGVAIGGGGHPLRRRGKVCTSLALCAGLPLRRHAEGALCRNAPAHT